MAPNFANLTPSFDPEAKANKEKVQVADDKSAVGDSSYGLQLLRSGPNALGHTLIGITVNICLWFALRNILTTPLTATQQHISLCVFGYQFLMAEAILCFSSGNGWSNPLRLKHKRLVHWVLQIAGSGLALAGSFIMMISRSPNNFGSTHGIMGLVAMVFTTVSLVNGLASLYAFELRGFLNANFTKAGHICFGTAAFVSSSVCLCLGLDKNNFKNWSSPEYAYVLIGFTGLYTLITVTTPLFNFGGRIKNIITKD